MFSRSARLIKLATKQSEQHCMDKNKSVDNNILTNADEDTGKYPLLFYY